MFILPVAGYLIATCFYPLFQALRMGFYDTVARQEVFVGLEHYRELIADSLFWQVVAQTFIYCVLVVSLHLLVGLVFALLLNGSIKYKSVWRGLQFIPWLFPAVVAASVWRLIYQGNYGALNVVLRWLNLGFLSRDWLGGTQTALPSVAAAAVWNFYPFFTLMLLAGLQNIPHSQYEAAKIDGAGAWSRLRFITLPFLKPVIFTICLLDMIWAFRFFDLVWVMTRGGPITSSEILPTYLYKTAFYDFDFGRTGAIGGFMIIFMLIFVIGYLVLSSEKRQI